MRRALLLVGLLSLHAAASHLSTPVPSAAPRHSTPAPQPAPHLTPSHFSVPAAVSAHAPPDWAEYDVDLARSYVSWTGTKFRGRGKHEGIVRIRSGRLGPCTLTRCRGRFTLDMHNLEITDIPASDPVPRRRLLEHLRSRDFFWTERYPLATFLLVDTRPAPRAGSGAIPAANDSNTLHVTGELTLRGVTRSLTFSARVDDRGAGELHIRADVVIDRQQWGVSYRFDPIRNEIVDDDITLGIVLVATAR